MQNGCCLSIVRERDWRSPCLWRVKKWFWRYTVTSFGDTLILPAVYKQAKLPMSKTAWRKYILADASVQWSRHLRFGARSVNWTLISFWRFKSCSVTVQLLAICECGLECFIRSSFWRVRFGERLFSTNWVKYFLGVGYLRSAMFRR